MAVKPMSQYDNEFNQGALEMPQTLDMDLPTTAQSESRMPTEPEQAKGGSSIKKLVKGMKLLAACLAIVTLMSTAGTVSASVRDMKAWPWIGPCEVDYGYAYNAYSRNGGVVQFAMGDEVYRLTASSGDLCFMWSGTDGYDGSHRARIDVRSLTEDWMFMLRLSEEPYDYQDGECAYGSISTTTGKIFYLEAVSYVYDGTHTLINTSTELQVFLNKVLPRVLITAGVENGWGKILIADTMYSTVDATWDGQETIGGNNLYLIVHHDYNTTVGLDRLLDQRTINNITWSFYYDEYSEYGGEMIWFVAGQERDTCFGVELEELIHHINQADVDLADRTDVFFARCCDALSELLTHYYLWTGI